MAKPSKSTFEGSTLLSKPQGAPRGLLLHYILHRISKGPTHGYEIAQDIETKTEGAWRPAPGSIYPMLKKLVSQGLIKASGSPQKKTSEKEQHVYEITPKGRASLKEAKEMFSNASHRWTLVRGIFIELIEPEAASRFLIEGSRWQFDGSREVVETKLNTLPPAELESVLKEYALNIERQLDWTRNRIAQLGKKYGQVQTQRSR
jgi:DNA-binding PadR family transcriptional regulator